LTPAETTGAIVAAGERVLTQPLSRTLVLSLRAGFYIAFGAQLATVVTSDAAAHLGLGVSRLLGGSVFSLGLMLVVVCGAELFTGNSLLAKAALHGRIPWGKLAENWGVVLLGNFAGSLFFAWLMTETGLWQTGRIGEHAISIAATKCQLEFWPAFVRAILCNWLVCLAVFMATAARDVAGKLLACYVPIMAFVASGFEHNVANMYFIPYALLVKGFDPEYMAKIGDKVANLDALTWTAFFINNLIPVTIGNIIGGAVFVAAIYWVVFLRVKQV
jgi:formate/nitrite transporter